MALSGSTIASTFLKLLRMNSDTMGADATASYLQDSADTDSALSISTTRVGIGTAAPDTTLEVRNDHSTLYHGTNTIVDSTAVGNVGLTVSNYDSSADYATIRLAARSSGSAIWDIVNEYQAANDGDLIFRTRNAANTSLEVMRLDQDGKVGIGNAAPQVALHVEGTDDEVAAIIIEVDGTHATNDYPALQLLRSKDAGLVADNDVLGIIDFMGYLGSNGDWYTNYEIGASIIARVNGTASNADEDIPSDLEFWTCPDGSTGIQQRMTINADGNVGIGQPSPSWPLECHGNGNNAYVGTFEQAHTTGWGVGIKLGAATPTTDDFYIKFLDVSGNTEGSVSGGGDNTIDVNITSDRRMKKNIIDLPDAMSIISQIKPRTFKWKNRGSNTKTRYGFIADEWFDVFPDSVVGKRDSDGKLIADAMTTNMDGEEVIDRQMISTAVVIPVLVKAIQELSAKVTALENA